MSNQPLSRKRLELRAGGWSLLGLLSALLLMSGCLAPVLWSFAPPYGGRFDGAYLFAPTGSNARGIPKPIITREGDGLTFAGFYSGSGDRGLAFSSSHPKARGYGLWGPVVWGYEYGRFRWDEARFPPAEQQRLRSEVDRVRVEVANALLTDRSTWYKVPPGYFQNYAAGEGTMWFVSWAGIGLNLVYLAAIPGAWIGFTMSARLGRQLAVLEKADGPVCPSCGYAMKALPGPTCPECGRVSR